MERDQVLMFNERVSIVFPDIQFTMKGEENNQLAFRGVFVCCKDYGSLKTRMLRKPTNAVQVLNFNSSHPSATNAVA
ncbi:unnamed protein product [Dibothriocephalus latus]|uniref:Uncharacterized protein n=1 Tax=Dibothriocephalus latus TaxID=60516 RepID=A0A3P7LDP1_DIBLA|nr:unnamed protein product [Dibothriocephalus latus]